MIILGKIENLEKYHFVIEKCIPGYDVGWGCLHRSCLMLLKILLFKTGRSYTDINFEDIIKYSGAISKKLSLPSQSCQAILKILQNKGISSVLAPSPLKDMFPRVYIFHTRFNSGNIIHNSNLFTLKHLLQIPYFSGALGGTFRKAVTIVGIEGDKVVCFDPHINSLSIRKISIKELDPSFVFTYLIKNPLELTAMVGYLKCFNVSIDLLNSLTNVKIKPTIRIIETECQDWININ